jgi:hypothetical protein
MKALHISAGVLTLAATTLLPLSMMARGTSPEYAGCMQQATDNREVTVMHATQNYNREYEAAMEERRQRYNEAWNQPDDRAQRDMMRDADRAFRDRTRSAQKERRNIEREASRAFNDDRRECRNIDRDNDDGGSSFSRSSSSRSYSFGYSSRSYSFGYSSSSRSTGIDPSRCYNSNSCPNGTVCSTEYGECESACYPGAETCIQVCAGSCVQPRAEDGRCFSDNDCRIGGWRCDAGRCVPPPPQTTNEVCRNSNDCRPGYRCSTEDGACESPCAPGDDRCIQVCSGRCVLNSI